LVSHFKIEKQSENISKQALRRLKAREMKAVEAGENHVKRSSVICVYHRILLGKSNQGV
jgi:hypothetical protein